MTDTNHPITPTPELIRKWAQYRGFESPEVLWRQIATQAANWGADMELEACRKWASQFNYDDYRYQDELRALRRPKPPSLKELNLKHLEVMERDGHYLPEIIADLRRAIESLPE